MELTYSLEPEDYWQFNLYLIRRIPAWRTQFLIQMAIGPLLLFFIAYGKSGFWESLGVGLVAGGLTSAWIYWRTKRRSLNLAAARPGAVGERTLTISPEGVQNKTTLSDGVMGWKGIAGLQDTPRYIYLFLDAQIAFIVPKRIFASPQEQARFVADAVTYWEAARRPTPEIGGT